jgi:heterodisulfide reductase subunit C/nitrate reductase gamma subunit
MSYHIPLYIALVLLGMGFLYKVFGWLLGSGYVLKKKVTLPVRIISLFRGILSTLLSSKFFTLMKVFFLDILIQRQVLREDAFRWIIHHLIYGSFMLLLLMHALGNLVTANIFPDYAPTLNPFLFLRNLFGILLILGLCLALLRRMVLSPKRLRTNTMDIYAIILLGLIMVTGFLMEGAKIGSYAAFDRMVEDFGDVSDEEERTALTAYWVSAFGTVAPDIHAPFDDDLIKQGKEIHEMSCSACHSRPDSAFLSFQLSRAVKGFALRMDQAGIPNLLFYVHVFACLLGLAYLPFSKFFHIITSPLSLLLNSVMQRDTSDPSNFAFKQALELDACTHCGQCTSRCSVVMVYEAILNPNILPSEKVRSLKGLLGSRKSSSDLRLILEGTYLCTNCHRCTDVCPSGINLQELWFSMREALFQGATPEYALLSPLSFYRGLMKKAVSKKDYNRPLDLARKGVMDTCDLMKNPKKSISITPVDSTFQGRLLLSDQAATFSACFGCQTCTNACPVVANYKNPKEVLGMLPHQIMYAAGLGIKDLAFGSGMLWDCVTCYQCQEQCPQNVKVTEVLYELKNLAIKNANNGGWS